MLVFRNLLIIAEGLNLHTFDIRTKQSTSKISMTKKCISLYIDALSETLYAGSTNSVIVFKIGIDRVVLE